MSSNPLSPLIVAVPECAMDAPRPDLFALMTRFAWARSHSDDLSRALESLPDPSSSTVRIRRSVEGEIGAAGQAEIAAGDDLDIALGGLVTAEDVRTAMALAGDLRILPKGVDLENDVLRRIGEAWARQLSGEV